MARVNYSQQKRLKDLERQRKQEEKRQRRHSRDTPGEPDPDAPETDTLPGDADKPLENPEA